MKYYKVEDNNFCGFYDEEIHKELLFEDNSRLKENFVEITDERWLELLDGQCEGKEIRILKSGELGLYQVPNLEEEMINPIFDYDKEIWVEQATDEEQLKYWEDKMIANQTDINLRSQVGLAPTKEQLELKSKCMSKHYDICHIMALKLNSEV